MTERTVRKNLIVEEDLALGRGTVTQTRQGVEYPLTKLDILKVVTTQDDFDAIDETRWATVLFDGSIWQYNFTDLVWEETSIFGLTGLVFQQYALAAGQDQVTINEFVPTTSLYWVESNIQIIDVDIVEDSTTSVQLTSAPQAASTLTVLSFPSRTISTADASNVSYAGENKTVEAKLNELNFNTMFGADPDLADNAAAFEAFYQYCRQDGGRKGGHFKINPGTYFSSEPLQIKGYGITLEGEGHVRIQTPDVLANEALSIGSWGTTYHPLVFDLTAGNSVATIADTTGYRVGDIVWIRSGQSANSTPPGNIIWLYKQWFHIREITATELKFSSPAEFDFTAADNAEITPADSEPAIGCTLRNLEFANTSGFTGPYLTGLRGAVGFVFDNVRYDAYSSIGFIGECDLVSYRNCSAIGYGGYGSARGTKRVSYEHCIYRPRFEFAEDRAFYFEETPERVFISNCDVIGQAIFGASADLAPPKQFIIRDSKIRTDVGIAVKFSGAYSAEGFAFDMDGCTIEAPGAVGAAGVKTVVDCLFFDSIRFTNNVIVGADGSTWAIAGSSVGAGAKMMYGNRWGASKGIEPTGFTEIEVDFSEALITGSPKISEDLEVVKSATQSNAVTARNNVSGNANANYRLMSHSGDANTMKGGITSNVNAIQTYSDALTREQSGYSGLAVIASNYNAANAALDRLSVNYQDTSSNDYTLLQVDKPSTATQTGLMLWDVDNATLERVTVGAADSGGTGFKVLRIPN